MVHIQILTTNLWMQDKTFRPTALTCAYPLTYTTVFRVSQQVHTLLLGRQVIFMQHISLFE